VAWGTDRPRTWPVKWSWNVTRRSTVAAVALTLLLGLVACGGSDSDSSALGDSQPPLVTPAQAKTREQRVLNLRTRAVRERNLNLFLQRVDHSDTALMARQTRYFRNLVQLPLASFGYRVLDQQWDGVGKKPGWGPDVHVPQVRLTTQLREYDAVPTQRVVGFVFAFRKGRAMIVSDSTTSGKPLYVGTPAPWDLTAITVRTEPGVLGIFDRYTRAYASTVTRAVSNGIGQITRALPFSWSEHVVVYSVRTPGVLASFTDVPGGSVDHLGALTFPTYAGDNHTQVASTRMLLMPSSVRAGSVFLGRITRHELSHVAIGVRDDGAPAWLSEGLAEYLGAREVAQRDRIIPTSALSRAETEDNGMPVSSTFNNTDQEWHYALSWMACDYIAATNGESRIWELVDAMHNGGAGTRDSEQDRVLVQVLGYDGHELARRAAARIRNLYG